MKGSDASPSAAGYGYQYERALYRIFNAPNMQTRFGIETADDVEEVSQSPTGTRRVSEQAKLSVQPRKNPLQDSSINLWKTLRIWLKGLSAARQEHDELEYLLVTNCILKNNTLAMQLSYASCKQSIAQAVIALRKHSNGMTGKAGLIAQEVASFPDADLEFLVGRMRIEDGQFNSQMKQRIIASLHLPSDALAASDSIYYGLVGLLFDRCQEAWLARKPFWTSAQPFYNQLHTLVEAFMNGPWEALPFEKTEFAEWAQRIDPADMLFVKQLEKLSMPNDLLMEQFSFFCAAYSERVRLLDSGRVLLGDFDNAERGLSDRWRSIGSAHRMDSGKSLDQFDVQDYKTVLRKTLFPDMLPNVKIGRVNSSAQYLVSGTYHRMVNGAETLSPIHWHRDTSETEDSK
ncbi:TPA: ABC-three component system protein [Pseudomonas aeruginosa]